MLHKTTINFEAGVICRGVALNNKIVSTISGLDIKPGLERYLSSGRATFYSRCKLSVRR
jgi:hypothetical protein